MKYISLLFCVLFFFSCTENKPTPTPTPIPTGKTVLHVKIVTADSVVLEWAPIPYASNYIIMLNDVEVGTTKLLYYTVRNLSPATDYTIAVLPTNNENIPGEKNIISLKTPKKEVLISQSNTVVNPFLVSPLTAIVRIGGDNLFPEQVEEIRVKTMGRPNQQGQPGVTVEGTLYPQTSRFKNCFFDITKSKMFNTTVVSAEDSVEIPVLGLYEDFNNTVLYEVETSTHIFKGNTLIQVPPLPDRNLKIEIITSTPQRMEPTEVTWITGDLYHHDFMFDHNGEIRFFIQVGGKSDMRILQNGNLLVRTWWSGGNFGEYSLLGEQINTWSVAPYDEHHDIYEMPNGNFLIPIYGPARQSPHQSIEDAIIEIERKTSRIVNFWDLFELMEIAGLKEVWQFPNSKPVDWFHMNSLCYDSTKDEIIVSGKQGGVIKLSRNGENGDTPNKNKEIVWFMPRHSFYTNYANHDATKDYILTAVDAQGMPLSDQSAYHNDFHWTSDQHNPNIIPSEDGKLHFLIFNNVYQSNRSAVVEFIVDESNKTVQQVWKYGQDREDLYHNGYSGATWLPKTNNRMMIPSNKNGPKMEVAYDGTVVFEYKIVGVSGYWYRAGRINLYPDTK